MRSTPWSVAVALILATTSCSRDASDGSRLSDDLEQDLAKASAASVELAGAQGYQQTRVVSDLEQIRQAEPVRRRPRPVPVVVNHAADEPTEVDAPEPSPLEAEVEAVAQEPDPIEPAPAPRVPVVAPRPAPVPVDMSGGGGGGGVSGPGSREGPDWGTVIGVILRGGASDPGHCPPRRRPRPGVGIPFPR